MCQQPTLAPLVWQVASHATCWGDFTCRGICLNPVGRQLQRSGDELDFSTFHGLHPFVLALPSDVGRERAIIDYVRWRGNCGADVTPMAEVSFRFYAQLNDFLPAHRRGRRFTHVLQGLASVKDAIEALGVPHPEVDVIVVNRKAEDFSYRLHDGDDVSVYPIFRSIDISGIRRAGTDPPQPVRFALDVHLGKLASLLRLVGFDTVLLGDDAEMAAMAARDGRIVLTRDVGLLKRSVVRHGHWVRHTDPESQLAEVLERFDLANRIEPFVRCVRCNTLLVPVDAEAVADRLPPRTRAGFRQFHRCPGCERVYWQGSHYDRLVRLVERARERGSARTR
jgi:uncharacterized protein with PIN domain